VPHDLKRMHHVLAALHFLIFVILMLPKALMLLSSARC
jgi:hypothetical protein